MSHICFLVVIITELFIVFLLFTVCMAVCLALGVTMVLPLCVGFFLFSFLAFRRGRSVKQILSYAKGSLGDSFIVIVILLLIGCLTGLWRVSGTVAYFVSLGVSLIPPRLFLLAAFLLSSLMSFALGTSFGVTATAGVILISIARAGGVNPVLAAGAILSGVYVGDRGSPAASSANLVAVLTHTDMPQNVRDMLRCSVVPFLLCCVLYTLLSFLSPMHSVDTAITDMLAQEFALKWYCLIPAILMIVLPFCNVNIKASMLISLFSSFIVSVFVQGETVLGCLRAMLLGFEPEINALSPMLSGGGIASMLEVCVILVISGTYGGIFENTDILDGLSGRLSALCARIGRFGVMLLLGTGACALFCNQTIGVIMQSQLASSLYADTDEERRAKMLDIENSSILVAGLIPWCIACSVPLAMLDADVRAVPFSFYLWLVPLLFLITRKKEAAKNSKECKA